MRDLKSNNVFNFSRSRMYDRIAKSRRYLELKQATTRPDDDPLNRYFDHE